MHTLHFHINDGGRRTSGRHLAETRDCTVRALATAAQIPYDTAHSIAKSAGRKNRRGFRTTLLLKHAEKHGVNAARTALGRRRVKVSTFIRQHSEGRYIVRIRRHAFAVIDGVIHDLDRIVKPGCLVTHAWRIS